jgi:mono/diheme cytochrome c family protein
MHVVVRRLGIGFGAILLLVVLVAATVYVASEMHVNRKIPVAAESLAIPSDSASIARGRHLARAIAKCTDCHGDDFGGKVLVNAAPMGRWVPLNVTRGKGGLGAQLSDADIVRAVRHGVAPDGRKLMMMPSYEYSHLSAEDVGAIVAYVRSLPPVDRELPPSTLGPVARALIALDKLPLYEADRVDHALAPATAPPAGPTAEYGRYIARVGGCMGCHGETLAGGKIAAGDPSWPPAANLTPTGIGPRYTSEDMLFKALRDGVKPEGAPINPAMPFRLTKEMTDDEIRAVWAFLKTLPPREFGAR